MLKLKIGQLICAYTIKTPNGRMRPWGFLFFYNVIVIFVQARTTYDILKGKEQRYEGKTEVYHGYIGGDGHRDRQEGWSAQGDDEQAPRGYEGAEAEQ